MTGSIERVRAVLRNEAVLGHFGGEALCMENASRVIYRASAPAIDATRPVVRLPQAEGTALLEDGRCQRFYRWTTWTDSVSYADIEGCARAKRREMGSMIESWSAQDALDMTAFLPEPIDELLEASLHRTLRWIEHLPERQGSVAEFSGDDIAWKGGGYAGASMVCGALLRAARPGCFGVPRTRCQSALPLPW